jgi:hypothetical protein
MQSSKYTDVSENRCKQKDNIMNSNHLWGGHHMPWQATGYAVEKANQAEHLITIDTMLAKAGKELSASLHIQQ